MNQNNKGHPARRILVIICGALLIVALLIAGLMHEPRSKETGPAGLGAVSHSSDPKSESGGNIQADPAKAVPASPNSPKPATSHAHETRGASGAPGSAMPAARANSLTQKNRNQITSTAKPKAGTTLNGGMVNPNAPVVPRRGSEAAGMKRLMLGSPPVPSALGGAGASGVSPTPVVGKAPFIPPTMVQIQNQSAAATHLQIFSQQPDLTNPETKKEVVRLLRLASETRRAAAWEKAAQNGVEVKGSTRGGGSFELQDFEGDRPIYYRTQNRDAAVSTNTHAVRRQVPYLGVEGEGMVVGVWDSPGLRATHAEFLDPNGFSRVTVRDVSAVLSQHPTHVACTIAGAGTNVLLLGMAPAVNVYFFDYTNDISEMTDFGAASSRDGILVANGSYGQPGGWTPPAEGSSVWSFYGTFTDDNTAGNDYEDFFGHYSSLSAGLDALAASKPYFMIVRAGGNDRNEGPPPEGTQWRLNDQGPLLTYHAAANHPPGDGQYAGGYDCIGTAKVAKNILTVGAVNDAVSGPNVRSVPNGTMTEFSSWGPADDGRIKPDIVGNGFELESASHESDAAHAKSSGTSMACPNVSGSAILLQELFVKRSEQATAMRAASLKGLIIATADDIGPPVAPAGPDYKTGWGLMNTEAAAEVINGHFAGQNGGAIFEETLAQGDEPKTYHFYWDGTKPLTATLCWTDPAGTVEYTHNDRTRDLVNDLSLKVTGPTGAVSLPYVMPFAQDPAHAAMSAPATTGVNDCDNVEKIVVASPQPGVYAIEVSPPTTISGGIQEFSLILSGNIPPGEIQVTKAPNLECTNGETPLSFGVVTTAAPPPVTLAIKNVGSAPLSNLAVTIDGPQAGSFAIDQPQSTVPTGLETHFDVAFTSTLPGFHVATLHIRSNDVDENPFDIQVVALRESAMPTRKWLVTGQDGSEHIALDRPCNVITAGNVISSYTSSPHVAKYDVVDGTVRWQSVVTTGHDGTDHDEGLANMIVDNSGDVVITTGTAISLNSTQSLSRGFTSKLSGANGLFLWDRSYDYDVFNRLQVPQLPYVQNAIRVDAAGNLYSADSTSYYYTDLTHQSHFLVLSKFSSPGVLEWQREMRDIDPDVFKCVGLDRAGNFFVDNKYAAGTGLPQWPALNDLQGYADQLLYSVSSYPGNTGTIALVRHWEDAGPMVIKLNSNGTRQWTTVINDIPNSTANIDDGAEWIMSVRIDHKGDVFILGTQWSSLFGSRAFLAKLASANGTVVWKNTYQSGLGRYFVQQGYWAGDYASTLKFDTVGNPVVTIMTYAGFTVAPNGWQYSPKFYWHLQKYASGNGNQIWEASGEGETPYSDDGFAVGSKNRVALLKSYPQTQVMLFQDESSAPAISVSEDTITVDEGETASNSGAVVSSSLATLKSVFSPDISSEVPHIEFDAIPNTDIWTWDFDTVDGPDETSTVTITAKDALNQSTSKSFSLVVRNVPPGFSAGPDVVLTPAEAASFQRTITFTDPGRDVWTARFSSGSYNGSVPVNQATKSLVLSFAFVTPGVFPIDVTIDDGDPGGATTRSFKVTVQRLIADWREKHFGTRSATGEAADTADADGDGIPNLAEFAFNLDPKKGDGSGLPSITIGNSGSGLPGESDDSGALDPKASANLGPGDKMTISFTEPPATTGIIYGAEYSTNLTSWSPITDTGTGGTHTFNVPVGSNTKLFMRLKVTTTP